MKQSGRDDLKTYCRRKPKPLSARYLAARLNSLSVPLHKSQSVTLDAVHETGLGASKPWFDFGLARAFWLDSSVLVDVRAGALSLLETVLQNKLGVLLDDRA
jgi:hypothetical protein